MNIYYQEIARIGIKFNINSNLIKEIYNYNKNNYPNHIEVLIKNEYNIQLNLKYCHISKSYFKDDCHYCNEKIKCNKCNKKYARQINHAYCNNCKLCINNNHEHFYCNKCKKCCNESSHTRCKKCNQYGDINFHKYHDTNLIITTKDASIAYNLNVNLGMNKIFSLKERINYILIAIRLGFYLVKNNESYKIPQFKTAIINKLEEFIENPKFTINQQILLYKFKCAIENI